MLIAPLSYERYAVLVSPLMVPDAQRVDVNTPVRRVEELSAVNPTSRYANSRAEPVTTGPAREKDAVQQKAPSYARPSPLHGPPPPDTKNFLPSASRAAGTLADEATVDPATVVKLYERSETRHEPITAIVA